MTNNLFMINILLLFDVYYLLTVVYVSDDITFKTESVLCR